MDRRVIALAGIKNNSIIFPQITNKDAYVYSNLIFSMSVQDGINFISVGDHRNLHSETKSPLTNHQIDISLTKFHLINAIHILSSEVIVPNPYFFKTVNVDLEYAISKYEELTGTSAKEYNIYTKEELEQLAKDKVNEFF